ncbi:MAG: hypothetical protein ACKO0V_03055, partial [bacterium]
MHEPQHHEWTRRMNDLVHQLREPASAITHGLWFVLALPILFDNGWADRLVYASHSPILIAHSSIARVLADLSDTDAMKILNG